MINLIYFVIILFILLNQFYIYLHPKQANKRFVSDQQNTTIMIKNPSMSQNMIARQALGSNRYDTIQKNYINPQNNYYTDSSYQNGYPQNNVDYSKILAKMQNPITNNQNRQFQGKSSYNDAYKHNENYNGRPQKFKQPDNLKVSNQPFNSSTQYTDQLKGKMLYQKTQRYNLPQNQVFPKGNFQGQSLYNNSYIQSQIRKQPQYKPQGQLRVGQGRFQGLSSYINDYAAKRQAFKPQKIVQKNNDILPKGNFTGQSTYGQAYVSSKIQKSRKFVPESQLKVGGKFQGSSSYLNDFHSKQIQRVQKYMAPQNQTLPRGKFQGQSNYNDSYTGAKIDKAKQFKPQQQWKIQGQFQGNSSYLNDFKKHQNAKRSQMAPLPQNKFMPEGNFQATSSYQNSYQPNVPTRERQFRPVGQLKIGGQQFEGNTSYLNDYAEKIYTSVPAKFKPQQNQVMPRGRFEGQSSYHQVYVPTAIEKGESFRPKPQLQVGGKFQGTSNYAQQYSQKKAVRAERVPLPVNQVIPQGRFDGNSSYANTYVPTAIQRTEKIIMKPQLKVGESRFEGNSTYAQNYQYSPVKNQPVYQPQQQYGQPKLPKWNKKTSRWQ